MQRKFVFAGNKALASEFYGAARRLAERVIGTAALRKLDNFRYSIPLGSGVLAEVKITGGFATTTIMADGVASRKEFSFETNPFIIWVGEEGVGYVVSELDETFGYKKSVFFDSAAEMFAKYPRSIEIDLYDDVIHFPDSMGSHHNLSDKYPPGVPLPVQNEGIVEALNEQTFMFGEMGGTYVSIDVNDSRVIIDRPSEIDFDKWDVVAIAGSEFTREKIVEYPWPLFGADEAMPLDFVSEKRQHLRPVFEDFFWQCDGVEIFSISSVGREYESIYDTGGTMFERRFYINSTHSRLINLYNSGVSCTRSFGVTRFRLNSNIASEGYRYMRADAVALANIIFTSYVRNKQRYAENLPYWFGIQQLQGNPSYFNEEVFYIIQTPVGSAIIDREDGDNVFDIDVGAFRTEEFVNETHNSWLCTGLPLSSVVSEIAETVATGDGDLRDYVLFDSNVFSYEAVQSGEYYFDNMDGAWVLERLESLPNSRDYANAPKSWTSDCALKLMYARAGASGIVTEVYMSFYRIGQISFNKGMSRARRERVLGAAKIVTQSNKIISEDKLKKTIRDVVNAAREHQLTRHPDKLTNEMPHYAKGHIGMYDAIKGYSIEDDGSSEDMENENVRYSNVFLSLIRAIDKSRIDAELSRLSYSHPLENAARIVANKINETEDQSYLTKSDSQNVWVLCRAYQAHSMREVENHGATAVNYVSPAGISIEDFINGAAGAINSSEYKYYGVGYLCPSTMTPWIKAHIVVVVLGK